MSDAVERAKAVSTVMALDVLFDAARCRASGAEAPEDSSERSAYFEERAKLLVEACEARAGAARNRGRGSAYFAARARLLHERFGDVAGLDELRAAEAAAEAEEAAAAAARHSRLVVDGLHSADLSTPASPSGSTAEDALDRCCAKTTEAMLLAHDSSESLDEPSRPQQFVFFSLSPFSFSFSFCCCCCCWCWSYSYSNKKRHPFFPQDSSSLPSRTTTCAFRFPRFVQR